ncbi:MAG: BolA family transcriptional regulator [Betaproteobacteria bacterium]|nr:BolA family transcriptional regulator [Betaproteobacteria bacterium]
MTAETTADRMHRLLSVLQPTELAIRDDSRHHAGHAGAGNGGHYKITIVAEAFRGLSPLQRHRLVHDALAPLMSHEIHALAIKASTP